MNIIELEDMTHEELASWARKVSARTHNDVLRDAAIDLQDAVDAERESMALANRVIALLQA